MRAFLKLQNLYLQEHCYTYLHLQLLLDIRVHFLVNKLLNTFAFFKILGTSLLSTSSGGISGTLRPFTNVFEVI